MQQQKQPSFLFTILTAVYNAQEYLEETVQSVLEQNIGFRENVQLILVNDGSVDGSLAICERYARQYPENILVLSQPNAGVAAARNAGLAYVRGKYLNFLDSDDKLSPETLREVASFFALHEQEVDIVTVPMFFFDAQRGPHWQNFKFAGGTRVADLRQEYANPLMTVSASFMHTRCLDSIRFDGRLVCAEDAKVCLRVLQAKQKLGLVCEGRYLYRRRSGTERSLIQSAAKKKGWYLDYLRLFSQWAFSFYKEKEGVVPLFVQYTVMADLQWRINGETHWRELLSPREQEEYKAELFSLIQEMDDRVILAQKRLVVEHTYFLLSQKHGQPRAVRESGADVRLFFADSELCKLSDIPCDVQFVTLSKETVTIEGKLNLLDCTQENPPEISLLCGDERIPCQVLHSEFSRYCMQQPIVRSVYFRALFRPRSREQSVRVCYQTPAGSVEVGVLRPNKFCPVYKTYKNAYYQKEGWVLSINRGALRLRRGGIGSRLYQEARFLAELLSDKKKHNRKAALARLIYFCVRPFLRKKIWLVSDRVNKADDNGEAFFAFLRREKPRGINAVFVLQRSSPDYARLRKIGRVVEPSSWLHKLLLLLSDKNISSHADENVTNPFIAPGITAAYQDILIQKEHVFLQHGVIKDDLSDWLNRYKKNVRMFVTTTHAEYQSILECPYFYSDAVVKLVGLARHDRLYHDERRCITVMPTWRKNLTRTVSAGIMLPNATFRQSDYFQFYNSLLNHERLLACMKQHGYTLQFMPHPNMILEIDAFERNPEVRFLSIETSYREVFAQSNLIVTDYSSVAFDFAYLRKPVLYAQFDRESFFAGHTYDPGYYDYERDGFGEVEYSLEATVERLTQYIKNGCALKEKYRKRIDTTFPFADQRNCERTLTAILSLDAEV